MSETAKKYYFTYEESDEKGAGPKELLERILNDPDLLSVKDMTIGYWGECYDQGPQEIIDGIIANKDKFVHIERLFVGEMDYEECEVSWINQGNYTELFTALPNLKSLTIKGAQELVLGKEISHKRLEKLEIICGGLGADVIRDVVAADLPSLKTLILYLGVENYGYDAGMDDLKPLLKKDRFPALTHLGLVDSEEQDEVAELILESDIMPQLKILELSYGTLTDQGGQAILDRAERLTGLEKLEIDHHYMTDEMVAALEKLPLTVEISDGQDADDDYKYPTLTE